jgi:hypothetical protein
MAAVQNQGRKRALVVSISQYDKLESLDFCEKDGNKICEVCSSYIKYTICKHPITQESFYQTHYHRQL